jgi:hypothetical protein
LLSRGAATKSRVELNPQVKLRYLEFQCGLACGLTTSGLPIGLEFDALPGTDRMLLGLGVSLHRALGSIRAPQV